MLDYPTRGAKVVPIISIVGWHNAGKTLFLEGLIAEIRRRGVRLATVKHTGGRFHMDREGTDTWRFAQAGSDVVAISGRTGFALVEQRESELTLQEIIQRLPKDLDLIIVEGLKSVQLPKIEIVGAAGGRRIASQADLVALVSETPVNGEDVPWFDPGDVSGAVDLLSEKGFLDRMRARRTEPTTNGE